MDRKKIVIISILFGFAALYLILAKSRKDASRPLLDIDPGDIQAISLENQGSSTILRKTENGFVFSAPYSGALAYKEAVDSFIETIASLTVKRGFNEEDITSVSEFGITNESPLMVIKLAKNEFNLRLGVKNPVAEQYYVYIENTKNLCLTEKNAETLFLWRPEDFREKTLIKNSVEQISSVEVSLKNKPSLKFEKVDEDWQANEINSDAVYPCDSAKITRFLSIIAGIQIQDYSPRDEKMSFSETGLNSPSASLLVNAEKERYEINIGGEYGSNLVYTAVNGRIKGGIASAFVKELPASATSFAMVNIIDFNPTKIASFVSRGEEMDYIYEKERGRWYRTGGKKRETSEEKVYSFLYTMTQIKAEAFLTGETLGPVTKEYVFYDRAVEVLLHIIMGGISDSYVKAQLKDKKSIFGISKKLYDNLEL